MTSDRKGLLSGLVVADFGWAIAGPVLSRFMAHLGATVIKIETNTRLDATRIGPPFRGKPSRNTSGHFDQHNAGKQSIALNLKHPEGRKLALRLAVKADLVTENFVPGVLEGLGLDYEVLRRERPDVILVSSSAQGQTGPNSRAPGLGTVLQGLVGLAQVTGWPDRPPRGTTEPYTDSLVAWSVGAAVMAALDYRRRTGQGMHIDYAQFETVTHVLAPGALHEQLTGERHLRMGNASRSRAPEGVFPCAGDERWCAISIAGDSEWRVLADLIGFIDPSTAVDKQDLAWRMQHREALEAAIGQWSRSREVEVVAAQLQARGIAAHSVAKAEDVIRDEQLAFRGHFVTRDHPSMGEHLYEMPPYRLAEHALTVGRSPRIGEHTDEVLRTLLGLSDAEIGQARTDGALN